jgi:propionate CoA-transferase
MKAQIVSFEEAAARIPDGAAVSICGAWMLIPDRMLRAVEDRYRAQGHPRDVTAIFPICPGGVPSQPGIDRLAHPGLLRRTIGGSYPNASSPLRRLIDANQVEAYNFPTGTILGMLRECGARRAGFLSEKGIGTFVDPRQSGGKMNAAANDLLSIVNLGGREHLFLPAMPIDVAIIRATAADTNGNLVMDGESATLSAFLQAAATRASGGTVIAQVGRVLPLGSLQPHAVKVPGTLVDLVVVDPEQMQTIETRHDASLCGWDERPDSGVAAVSGSEAIIARRAAREIRQGDVVVLGYGISAYVPQILREQGKLHDASFAVEQGSIGGLPLTGFGFGNSVHPQAILDAGSQFDLFSGGCFDIGMLSFLQADARGRINVHKLAARPHLSVGIGGFLDIAASAPRLVVLGYFTAGGLEVECGPAGLRIAREGKTRKFVRQVDEISFDPAYGRAREILFITERAVLRYDGDNAKSAGPRRSAAIADGRWRLDEVARGIDLDSDVLAHIEFPVDTSRVQAMEAAAG